MTLRPNTSRKIPKLSRDCPLEHDLYYAKYPNGHLSLHANA